jgi:hypothetical protein
MVQRHLAFLVLVVREEPAATTQDLPDPLYREALVLAVVARRVVPMELAAAQV